MKTACFTGHRPPKINDGNISFVRGELTRVIGGLIEKGYTAFISGMAQGVDMLAAQAVLDYKRKNPEITLECAVPCRTQAQRWNAADKARYNEILAAADKVTVLGETYTPWCMQQRNMYMVDNSDTVIAVFDGSRGGTFNTVEYARRKGKELIIIPPGGEADGG